MTRCNGTLTGLLRPKPGPFEEVPHIDIQVSWRQQNECSARVILSHDSPFLTCMWTIFRLASRFSRSFSASQCRPDFHFDTHHFVQRLEREGLNRAQAEGIMSAMAEVIDESIRNMTSNMVTKAEQEKVRVSPTSSVRSPTTLCSIIIPNKWILHRLNPSSSSWRRTISP